MRILARLGGTGALVAVCALARPSTLDAAPVLTSADVRITVTSPGACDVTLALTVEGSAEIDHRIDARMSEIEIVSVQGAQQAGDLRPIGRTLSLVLRPDLATYQFRYRVRHAAAGKCSIWLPIVPTDGLSRAVHLQIDLPPRTVPGSAMPAVTWTGTRGSTMLGHVPAFVSVSYGLEGESPRWGIGQVMDAAAVAVFAGASAAWVWRRRR